MGKCLVCRPVLRVIDGADHVGVDFFLRCPRCQTRTTHHVEGYQPTPEIRRLLRKEWRAGRIETPKAEGE